MIDHHLARAIVECPVTLSTSTKMEWCRWVRERSGWTMGQVTSLATRRLLLAAYLEEPHTEAEKAIMTYLLGE